MKRTNHVSRLIGGAMLMLVIAAGAGDRALAQVMTPAKAISADRLAAEYTLDGAGIGVGVFEAAGRPNFGHYRLLLGSGAAQMVPKSPAAKMEKHATGVVGIIGANDNKAPGRGGIARGSTIYVYAHNTGEKDLQSFFNGFFRNWFNSDKALWRITNHSYGADGLAGWRWSDSWGRWQWYGGYWAQQRYGMATEDPKFGWYGPLAQQLDLFMSLNKDQITVFSAGNYRGKGPDASEAPLSYSQQNPDGSTTVVTDAATFPPINGGSTGYDCMEGFKISKNAITVGAVGYNSASKNFYLADFSSTGPTDDGRIKPDVVAFGDDVNVLRLNDDSLGSGTSYAAPAVTGVLAQLAQLWKRYDSNPMRSATARVLLCHTAIDMGDPGPDYRYGWGRVNALEAGILVSQRMTENRFNLQERSLKNGTVDTIYIQAVENKQIKVTMAWTDPAGVPVPADNKGVAPRNNRTRALQNDLDLRVYPITGETDDKPGVPRLPWELDPLHPTLDAVRKNNSVDNIEQVTLTSEKVFTSKSKGVYMIIVRHLSPLKNTAGSIDASTSQEYSIAISGGWEYLPVPRSIVASQTGETGSRVTWRSVPNSTGYDVQYRAVGDNAWITKGLTSETAAQFSNLQSGTWQVRVRAKRNYFTSNWSAPALFIIGPPKAPTGLNMTSVTSTSAVLRWDAVAGATSYEVAWAPVRTDGTELDGHEFETKVVTDTKLAVSGLLPDEYTAWFVRTRVAPMAKSEWAQGTSFATPIACSSYEPSNDEFETGRVARYNEYFSGLICRNDKADRYRIDPFEFPSHKYLLMSFGLHSKPYNARLYRRDKQSGGFTYSIVANTSVTLSPSEDRVIYYTSLDHSRYDYWVEVVSPNPASVYESLEPYVFWYQTSSTPFEARRGEDGRPSMSRRDSPDSDQSSDSGRSIFEHAMAGSAQQQ